MYTQSSCSERNSGTPLTQADIDRQNIRMNRQVQPMLDGNFDMAGLIRSLTPPPPANTCDDFKSSLSLGPAYPWPLPGWNGGVPESAATVAAARAQAASSVSSGTAATAAGVTSPVSTPAVAAAVPGAAPTPSGSPAVASPGSGWARSRRPHPLILGRGARHGYRGGSPYAMHRGILDQVQTLVTNFSCPKTAVIAVPSAPGVPTAGAPVPTSTPVAVPKPIMIAAPSAPAKACPPQSSCRTGNICLDLKRGCVSANQVDSAQLLACAEAGYSGNENFFPCVLAQPNLPHIGTPMPNPPSYQSVYSQDVPPTGNYWGLSGLGCDSGGGPGTLLGVLGIALGVAGGLFFADWISKQRIAA